MQNNLLVMSRGLPILKIQNQISAECFSALERTSWATSYSLSRSLHSSARV